MTDEYKQIFSPQNILNEMDVNSGSLNLSAIEMLRNVEDAKKDKSGLILMSTSIGVLLSEIGQNPP